MLKFTVKEIAEFVGGTLIAADENTVVDSVCVDSRQAKEGSIFFALIGEVTDGHRYIPSAIKNGASLIVVHEKQDADVSQIIVKDTFAALQELARKYIAKFPIPYVAITGSSGKTTTKDITAAVLSAKYDVLKTQGNLNSTTGVPLTLFDLDYHHEIGVIEMSMSHPGEILGNCEIVRPDTSVITNIGLCHIEFLETQDNIFKAKTEAFAYLTKEGTAIVNGEDKYFREYENDNFNLVKVGIDSGDLVAKDIVYEADKMTFTVNIYGKDETFEFSYPGRHNVLNCLSAIAVAVKYGLTADEIRSGLKTFVPSKNRMDIDKGEFALLINDTYNANPDSMKAALDVLCHMAKGRKIAVMGDMFELGDISEAVHKECGMYAAQKEIDLVYTVGGFKDDYKSGFDSVLSKGICIAFDDKPSLCKYLKETTKKDDTILFKASRGMELDEVYNFLKEALKNE